MLLQRVTVFAKTDPVWILELIVVLYTFSGHSAAHSDLSLSPEVTTIIIGLQIMLKYMQVRMAFLMPRFTQWVFVM